MRIKSFNVSGFANFTRASTIGPLDDIGVLYGPNNAGKSNLVRALELYFRLLGAGEVVTRQQAQMLDDPDEELAALLAAAPNRFEPKPIGFLVEWEVDAESLERAGLHVDFPCTRVVTGLELQSAGRIPEVRIQKWLLDNDDVAHKDPRRDAPIVGFAQQVRRILSDAMPFQADRPMLPYARVGEGADGFPQALRDRLFDARLSRSAAERRRWTLFAELAQVLRPELGEGQWEIVFDRESALADLVFVKPKETLTLDMIGAGSQRFARLAAELALRKERFICMEEPEWRLSPELQARLVEVTRLVIKSGVGPTQALITTHSPVLASQAPAFTLELSDGAPLIQKKPWELAAALEVKAAPAPAEPGLNDLIGLVESLAEIEPEHLVPASASGARTPARAR